MELMNFYLYATHQKVFQFFMYGFLDHYQQTSQDLDIKKGSNAFTNY